MQWHSVVIGCGSGLPRRQVANREIISSLDTSDAWIVQRTGIRTRYLADRDETTSSLALAAARGALRCSGTAASQLDLIVVATTTPDHTFPATAAKIQSQLGVSGCAAFDLQAVCSGFVHALAVADSFLRLGQAATALVIGAETFSRLLDWSDRTTCILFGDGAGAVVLRREQVESDRTKVRRGILSTHLHCDGRGYDSLKADGGPSATRTVGLARMDGREVFRQAVHRLGEVCDEALHANGITPDDLDWMIPHQANVRIIESVAQKLAIPPEKIIVTVDHHGNTSAASIPLALAEATSDGRIRPGHLILISALGAGFAWGAALVRW